MKIPQKVQEAWENKKGPVIFSTVDNDSRPNAIYATCVSLYEDEYIVVADNYFDKTRTNILNGSSGSVLFMSDQDQAFQIKGKIEYIREGEIYDDMKKWNPEKHPGHAAAALKIEEIYSGAEKII